jgi:flagellar transcriptional activator FlhD
MNTPRSDITDMADSIREVNLSYLLLAQHVLRADFEIGLFRLGLSHELGRILMDLSIAQVIRIASCGQLLCQFRLHSPAILEALGSLATDSPLHRYAVTHAAIVLAGQTAEQLR